MVNQTMFSDETFIMGSKISNFMDDVVMKTPIYRKNSLAEYWSYPFETQKSTDEIII